MSAVSRILSGSAAAWVQILLALLVRIGLVPLYLSFWSSLTYGIWLAISTLIEILQLIDRGHQQYVGFEFLRVGGENKQQLAEILMASIPFAAAIGALQIAIAWFVVSFGLLPWLFKADPTLSADLYNDAGVVVLFSAVLFGVFGSIGGLLTRVLAPLGFYPRMAWWGVVATLAMAIFPAIAVTLGGGILEAGLTLVASMFVYNLFLYRDMLRLMRLSGIYFQGPDLRLGFSNLLKSQALVATSILGMIRTTGARLVVAPLAGASALTAFATIRTSANLALQGLSTITGPLMPELMRVLKQRDQQKVEAAFGTVWLVLLAIIAPMVVILQVFVEPLFGVWTRGQVEFDPLLFSVFSLAVLVFALAQPAMAVVRGNNLLPSQFFVAVGSAVIVLSGMLIFVPVLGILGAGIALLAAEVFAAACYTSVAKSWMHENGVRWPSRTVRCAALSVFVAGSSMIAISYFPEYAARLALFSLCFLSVNLVVFWRVLPDYAKLRAKSIVRNWYSPKRKL